MVATRALVRFLVVRCPVRQQEIAVEAEQVEYEAEFDDDEYSFRCGGCQGRHSFIFPVLESKR